MASKSLGKKFEDRFKDGWMKTVPNSFLYRLHDQMSGYKIVSQNVSDYIGFADRKLFLLECKEHKGKSFPFSALSQYEQMLQYVGIPFVYPIVVIWFSECDIVMGVPIETIKQIISDGKKSVNINDFDKYKLYNIPSVKIKGGKFMESDYSYLVREVDNL